MLSFSLLKLSSEGLYSVIVACNWEKRGDVRRPIHTIPLYSKVLRKVVSSTALMHELEQ